MRGRTVESPALALRSYESSVELWSQEGTRLGHTGSYWVYSNSAVDPEKKTFAAPITSDGDIYSEFSANDASNAIYSAAPAGGLVKEHRLNYQAQIVIYRGEEYSDDMNDFSRPAARFMAHRQIDLALKSGFSDLMIQIRSHMQYYDDVHYGYAPASMAENLIFKDLSSNLRTVEQISTNKEGRPDRATTCQSDACEFKWRLARNQEVAHSFEAILKEVSDAYPSTRIQAALPESANATASIEANVPGGFNAHIDGGWNYSWIRFEGVAMASLRGTHVEPVLLGLRSVPPEGTREMDILIPFLRAVVPDRATKQSEYSGPVSVLYEAQNTLNAAGDPQRKLAICGLLASTSAINEVILYEAGDYHAWRSTPGEYDFLPNCREMVAQ